MTISVPSRLDQLLRFCVVGAIGFGLDGGVLWSLMSMGAGPVAARAISFPVAVTMTWWLNRNWTFGAEEKSPAFRQLWHYIALQIVGALANLGVYVLILLFIEPTPSHALAALTAGALLGLVVNFLGSKYLIFRAPGTATSLRITKEKS